MTVEKNEIRGWARKEYAEHLMSAGPCVSRRFRRADGRFAYAFNLTWVPGTVSLSGDVGEISIVHYHALRTFREGMDWLANADYDYLMGKASPREEVFDFDQTVRTILEIANSELRDALLARRSEVRDFVHAKAAAREEWREAFETWVKSHEEGEEAPKLEDYMPERGNYVSDLRLIRKQGYFNDVDERHIPDGYSTWFSIWKALSETDYGTNDPESIFRASGRREIREDLERYLSDGLGEHAASFCVAADISDYYGSTKYNDRSIWQIEALRHGARMILAEMRIEDSKLTNILRRKASLVLKRLAFRTVRKRKPA